MIRIIHEIAIQMDVYLCFMDYTKKFDKVRHKKVSPFISAGFI